MEKKRYRIGIVGGMGAEATKTLFERVIEKTEASQDQDHIPLGILNDTSIPDRTAHIEDGAPSPLPRIKENVELLRRIGVTHFAIPCNTAHAFSESLKSEKGLTFIDMVDATLQRLNEKVEDAFVLLATKGTLTADVYKRDLLVWEKNILYPDEPLQSRINDCIYAVKAGADKKETAKRLSRELRRDYPKSTVFILGCTELALMYDELQQEIDCLSSLDVLAEEIVNIHESLKEENENARA